MANHMAEVAHILGLELGEEFKLKEYGKNVSFEIVEDGLINYETGDRENWNDMNGMLVPLIYGSSSIIKKPFQPSHGEGYWSVSWDEFALDVKELRWMNWKEDYLNFKSNNCFRTRNNAEKNKYRIYEEITGKKWEEQ